MLENSILQQLEVAHRTSKRPIRFGVYYKNTLIALCHALEDHILDNDSSPLVITAFQQGKWYLQEADRYGEIAQKACQIVIMAGADTGFAEHPTSQLPNVDLVGLDASDPVAQEWHLMILSPKYTAIVLCQELSPEDYGAAGQPASDLERKFYGVWTFEPELVQETVELTIAHIGSYNSELQKKLIGYLERIHPSLSTPEDLSQVVSRVIDYLQDGQQDLSTGTHLSLPTPFRQQVLDRNLVSNEIQAFLRMAQLMDMADVTNPMAAAEVVGLAETMGQLLDLPAWQMKRLRLAGLLHRLDPMQRVESALSPGAHYHEDAPSCPLTCPLIPGTQVLRTMPQLRAVAQIITHQTEWWDGTGEPAGLAGDEIPLESRILGVVADFQWRANQINKSQSSREESITQALAECQQQQGTRLDPKLVETLSLLVMGLQQGLSLPINPTKVTAGLWLLDANLYGGTAVRSVSVAN